MADYTSEATFPRENDHALVVYCSDPYYMEGAKEFFERHHHLAHYDQIVEPGGPAVLVFGSVSYLSERGNFQLLNGAHVFRRVIGVAHLGCAYYAKKYKNMDAERRRAKQIEDLNKFAQEVQRLAPGVEILLYFAEAVGGHVQFTQVR